MARPTAAMLVIGDEILSGRTRDANMHHLAGRLSDAGIDLIEVRVVPDEAAVIVAALTALRDRADHVFTSGGIGPTHDDITADAVAAAFGVGIDVRDDARAILEERYARMGTEINAARLRMARIPDGATLIENPVSGAPGFSLGNVHVMAGVPQIFEAMVDSVLPTLSGGPALTTARIAVDRGEGDIADVLRAAQDDAPGVRIGSYPRHADGRYTVEIVLRGADPDEVAAVAARLSDALGAGLAT